jgi:hypothetical protein
MAESVKRRVAAARLAVAFVAAGTIAGATAWASAGPPPPGAESSAVDVFSKHKIDSGDIKNGSLLFQDFKAGEVLSNDVFVKYKKAIADYKLDVKGDSAAIKGELGDIKTSVDGIKGELSSIKGELSSYVKLSDADSRYLKLSDSVVRGDGSVFTASAVFSGGDPMPLLGVPGLIDVSAVDNAVVKITNTSGSPLTHSDFGPNTPAGVLPAGQSLTLVLEDHILPLQLIGPGATPQVATLNMTSIESQVTVQILIGL